MEIRGGLNNVSFPLVGRGYFLRWRKQYLLIGPGFFFLWYGVFLCEYQPC